MRPNWNTGQISNWGQPIGPLPRQPFIIESVTFGLPNMQSVTAQGSLSWGSGATGRGILCFFAVTTPITVTDLACNVLVAATGGELRAGVYGCNSDCTPGTLIADFGTMSAATTGRKEITGLSTVIQPGFYFTFLLANANITVQVNSGATPYWSHYFPASANPHVYLRVDQTYGVLPTTLTNPISYIQSAGGVGVAVMFKFR